MQQTHSITRAHLQRLLLLGLGVSAALLLSALLVGVRTVHQIDRNTQTFANGEAQTKAAIDEIEKQQAALNANWVQLAKKDIVRREEVLDQLGQARQHMSAALESAYEQSEFLRESIYQEGHGLLRFTVWLFAACVGLSLICASWVVRVSAGLFRRLEQQAGDLTRLQYQFLETQEDVARRFSHELHDELGQALTAVKANLGALRDHPGDSSRLDDCLQLVDRAIKDVREMSQLLRPTILDDFGLDAALRSLTESFGQRTGIQISYRCDMAGRRLRDEAESHLYRIAQEALTNVARHSAATEVSVSLLGKTNEIMLSIEDNGRGFDREQRGGARGLGLAGIETRARGCGGVAEVIAVAGKGVTIKVTCPDGVRLDTNMSHLRARCPAFLVGSVLGVTALFGAGNDEGYTAKIKEYTTDPKFLTELVDHLPSSSQAPTPEKVLGYVIGTPGKLTYTKDIYRYYRALADASPRVKMWTVGKSEEGRDFVMVAVSDEANIAQLDKLKEITAKLADPRQINDEQAKQLIAAGKPIYWASGSIHSPETGSPEMLMELAYRLAVDDTPMIQKIRKNMLVLITPVLEVDGRDREVDTYRYHLENPNKATPSLVYWGHYVAHDNNRDGIAQALQLSKTQMKNFLEWHPQVLHDLHESVPFLYISTGTGPYNAWLDPLVVTEWQKMAYNEIEQMTQRGVPGVWTHGYYDGWAPNYMFYFANGHNSIGRFYETFGNSGADTRMRTVPPVATTREWYRPNPPQARVQWSIRNNVNMQESALLFGLSYVSDHGDEFLNNFYLKSKRAVAKATTEGPAAWVIPNDGKRPELAAQLAALLQSEGCEVHRLTQDREAVSKGQAAAKLPAGSYVIRMDQPYSRIADMLLDTQYYNVNDPRPYDDTGWTLGALRNVSTVRVTDTGLLKAPMTLIEGQAKAQGAFPSKAAKAYLINANAEPVLATLRFRLKDAKIFAAEQAFEVGGKTYNPGSYIIRESGQVASQLEAAAKELGIRVESADAEPSTPKHEVATPRIALMHTWVNTQNEGWYRLALDEMKVPFTYISDQTVRATPNLREKFDVILFPPVGIPLTALIHGVPKRIMPDGSDFGGPIPWKRTQLTPNLSTGDGQPDQTDDMRGGLEFEGLAHLKQFVEEGGLFLCFSSTAQLPIDLGITSGVTISDTRELQAHGSVYQSSVEDRLSPIAYGYDEKLGVYFNQTPVFHVSMNSGGGGGGAGLQSPAAGPRGSGRGSLTDADVVQGRPYVVPEKRETPPTARERELYIDPDVREFMRATLPPPSMWPRVIVRFSEEKSLLISGELAGAPELANTPAVVDVPVGRGHVVLYAINPMWRHETHGSFMLVMNAALNFDHLQVGRKEGKQESATDSGELEQ